MIQHLQSYCAHHSFKFHKQEGPYEALIILMMHFLSLGLERWDLSLAFHASRFWSSGLSLQQLKTGRAGFSAVDATSDARYSVPKLS